MSLGADWLFDGRGTTNYAVRIAGRLYGLLQQCPHSLYASIVLGIFRFYNYRGFFNIYFFF